MFFYSPYVLPIAKLSKAPWAIQSTRANHGTHPLYSFFLGPLIPKTVSKQWHAVSH